MFLLGSLSI